MPVLLGGLLSGIGSLAGGIMGAGAQGDATKQAAESAQKALGFQQQVYGQGQQNLQPYIGTGQNALYSLASLYGLPGGSGSATGAQDAFQQYTQLPSYQFPLQQGMLAANRGLAAQGLTGSGGQAKALTQYGQGYASQGFQSYIDQLGKLAGMGQSAGGALMSGGNQAAQTNMQGSQYLGNTLAGGTIGQQASINQGIGGFLGALGAPNGSSTSYGPSNTQNSQPFNQTSPLGQLTNWLGSA